MVASPGSDKPRFRQDLVAEPVEDGASRFVDVADPDTGHVFRFYEVEYSLACAMDGSRDATAVVQWAKEELGLATSPKEVQLVMSTLRDLGYLEGGAAAAAAAQPAAKAPEKPTPVPAGVKQPAGKPAVNKWDAPTQMGDADDYLEPGVIVPKAAAAAAAPRGEDLELGQAGTSPKVQTELPRAPELELGAPGAAASGARAPAAKAPDVALGKSGKSEVSISLADHMEVGTDDVKAAVRASQVMQAVDVPKELLAAVEPTVSSAPEPKKAEPKAEAKKAEPKPEPKAEAKKAEPKPEPKAEAKKAEPKAEKPAPKVEARAKTPAPVAAKEPAREEKRPVAPPAPKSGTSPVLVALLVIAVLAAAGFFAYKYVFKKGTSEQASTTPPVQPKAPEPPPPPPVESEKLATEQPDAVDLKSEVAAAVEMVVAPDTAVKAGDTVAMLAGHKPIETEIAAIEKDIDTKAKPDVEKATKDRDAAQTAGNKAALTAAETKLAEKQKALTDKQTKLDAKKAALGNLVVKAPSDGKVTPVAAKNAKLAKGDVIAKLTPATVLAATFKTASGVTPGTRVLLAPKGSEQKLSCTVVTADASGTKIACPGDATTPGTEVTFVGPDPNAAAPQAGSGDEIEMGEGSAAAGSAAPAAGTTAPAAGSATTEATPPPAPKAPARPAPHPVHAAPKAPAHPAAPPTDKPADKPADTTPDKPADKPADTTPAPAPAPTPAPSGGDSLK